MIPEKDKKYVIAYFGPYDYNHFKGIAIFANLTFANLTFAKIGTDLK